MSKRFCNSPDVMNQACSADPGWAAVLETAREDYRLLQECFWDETDVNAGWGHDFVCPECASQLSYDIRQRFQPGQIYHCPHCGATAFGPVLDEACLYYHRFYYASHLLSPALLACFGDVQAREFIKMVLDHYAARYSGYPLHGTHAGQGRVTGQSLDEAVWALQLLRVIKICGFDHSDTDRWYTSLFQPLAQTIYPQASAIHNIPLWIQAAVGAIGMVFDKTDELERALHTPYGILAQAARGYTADGFWDECSTHYHYYATEALTHFASFNCEDPKLLDALAKAYQVPASLSPDGYHIPSLNDGWYPLTATTYASQLFPAARILASYPVAHQITRQLLQVRSRTPDAFYTPVGLLFGTKDLLTGPREVESAEQPAMVSYPDSRLAILREPVFTILKGGVIRESHMHQDALSVSLPPFSEDLGTPGYAHPLTSDYYRLSIAHNTVLCDGVGQQGGVKESQITASEAGLTAVVPQLYPDVCGTRTLRARSGVVLDTVSLSSNEAHQFTLLFHAAGVISEHANDGIQPVNAALPLYPLLHTVRHYPNASELTLHCSLDGKNLTVTVKAGPGAQFYTAGFPGNPADCTLRGIVCMHEGKQVEFYSEYKGTSL